MNLNNYVKPITQINKRSIHLKDSCDKNILMYAKRHPIIIVGEIPPSVLLAKFNIHSNENYILCSQVSHNLTNYKESINIDNNTSMKTNFILLPASNLANNLRPKANIFLKDQGKLNNIKVSGEYIILYNTRVEKANAFSRMTGYTYDHDGNILSIPAVGSLTSKQVLQVPIAPIVPPQGSSGVDE